LLECAQNAFNTSVICVTALADRVFEPGFPGIAPMVDRCVNPECRAEFRLLSAGDLYAHERRSADTEFFWLCSTCASKFDLYLDPSGCVSVKARCAIRKTAPPSPDGDLRLVSRSTQPAHRPPTLPSSERAKSAAVRGGSFFSNSHVRGASRR